MRKGKLLIVEKSSVKEADLCFDTEVKKPVDVVLIGKDSIITYEETTRTKLEPVNILTVSPYRFVNLFVEDEVTGEKFKIFAFQQSYVYSSEGRDRLLFITQKIGPEEYAFVICKESGTQSQINRFAPIADAYGMYICQQKAINEPAKKFNDWYFAVSI